MKTLTEIGQQIRALIVSMTPQARIMAGLMVGVIVLSIGWIVNSETSGKYESLLGGVTLSNAELDQIEIAFGDAKLRDYERIGRQIRIPSGQKDLYLKALSSANALPKEWGSEIDRALQNGNVFESSEKLNARMQTAEERELANTLQRMPGIEFAAVRFDERRRGFAREADRVCSIQLQGPVNTPIPESVLQTVAEHVSTHFAGLPETNISVLDLGTANFYRKSNNPHAANENPVLAARKEWELYLDRKLGAVLRDYGAVELMVNVDIDPTLSEELEKLQYDPTAVTLQSKESRRDSENAKLPPSGPPGADINGGLSNKAQVLSQSATSQSSRTKETEANERRVAGHDAIRKRTAGLSPTKVSVSIGIPDSYYRKVLAHRFLLNNPEKKATDDIPPPSLTELADLKLEVESTIRSAVEGIAMGIRDGDDRKPYVNVYAYTDLPFPEFPKPTLAQNTVAWLTQSWSTLALLGIVLIALGMMFSWVKSQGNSAVDDRFAEGFGLEVPAETIDELELSDTHAHKSAKTRDKPVFEVSGNEMKEDLSTLIKDNPDAVVNLLKTWIGEAA